MHPPPLLALIFAFLTTALASLESWEEPYMLAAIADSSTPRARGRMLKRTLAQPRREKRSAAEANFISERLDNNEVPSFVSGGYIDRKRALHANINAHLSFPRDLATPSDSTPAAERDALAARLRAVGKAGRKGNKRA